MDQPSTDDDACAWRHFAGELRKRMGQAYRDTATADARAADAEARAVVAEDRLRELTTLVGRSRWQLNRIEKLLAAGDVPAAVQVLARRRAHIEARKQAARSA